MCSPQVEVPFIGAKRSLYESTDLSSALLQLMGRYAADCHLKTCPVGTWVVRHSSFQQLLGQAHAYSASFDEPVQAFFAISVRGRRGVRHYLIAQVSRDCFYYVQQRQKVLVAVNSDALNFSELVSFMGLAVTTQIVYTRPQEYILI